MDKLNELKALADLAQQLEDNGHYVEANTVHNKFIRIAQQQRTYTVTDFQKPLREIADETGVSLINLQYFNKGISKVVPQGTVVKLGPAPKKEDPSVHIVGPGDSLSLIASKNKIGLDLLLKLNPQFNPRVTKKVYPLQPGDRIKLPVQKSSLESEYPEMPLT